MIITLGTQKGGVGKTTITVALANFLAQERGQNVKVFDYDHQKSLHTRWENDRINFPDKEPLYEVVQMSGEKNVYRNIGKILAEHKPEDIWIFDLAGTLDGDYCELFEQSDYVIIPFEYSEFTHKATLVFIQMLILMESPAEQIFVKSRYDKGFNYPGKEYLDETLSRVGHLIDEPFYKRNCLQQINTFELSGKIKDAVKEPIMQIIAKINEISKTSI